ncbi:MAG: NAD(P)/FAD-dependent oxidoreductase [Deltaproteobacteria bacterium]|nr:NAD(P)/FAD-dependent oxidoreductase [Deltaproteobacteria bacterium]
MKKVVIIGSGVGGSALAALLSTEGYSVTVLEKNAFVGGRAASYERDGFVCDMGVHYVGRGEKGPHGEVARRVGAGVGTRCADVGLAFTKPWTLLKMARLFGIKPRDFLSIFRAVRELKKPRTDEEIAAFDEVPLREFLLRYSDDPAFFMVMDMIAALLFVTAVAETSLGEFMHSFSTWANLASSSYPKGGFIRIAKSFLEAAERNGAKVLTGKAATAVRLENGRAVGVECGEEFFPADLVVSNAGVSNTVKLAGEDAFGKDYAEHVSGFKYSGGAVTLKYGLDYAPMDIPILLQHEPGADSKDYLERIQAGEIPQSPPLFAVSPTVVDPSLAPPGKHLLLVATVLPPSLEAEGRSDEVLDRLERKMPALFPGIENHILWKHRTTLEYTNAMSNRGMADCIGLAQTHYQCGRNKPDPRTPVPGLYLVGCDSGGRGIGTEQASDSALNVCEMILADAGANRREKSSAA